MPRSLVLVRTSQSHPLRICEAEVRAGDTDGLIGITFCPGKRGSSLSGDRWERDLAADLDVVAAWRARSVVTLIEEHEFTMLGVPGLGEAVQARGMSWHHLPIVDVHPPDERFEAAWLASGRGLLDQLRGGERVLVHCRGGLGRAGTVSARLLIELGVSGQAAVSRVRAARPGAIETSEQPRYLLEARWVRPAAR